GTLPQRYLGASARCDARVRVVLTDLDRYWNVHLTSTRAYVAEGHKGHDRHKPDVTMETDSTTWLALREGELSGPDAFIQRRLPVRGDLAPAIAFEGFFRLPTGNAPLLRLHDVPLHDGRRISTLTMGSGPDVLLIHGLGATKTSFFEAGATLAAAGHR